VKNSRRPSRIRFWLVERLGKRIWARCRSPHLPIQPNYSWDSDSAQRSLCREPLQKEGIVVVPGALLASARRIRSGDLTKTQAFAHGEIGDPG